MCEAETRQMTIRWNSVIMSDRIIGMQPAYTTTIPCCVSAWIFANDSLTGASFRRMMVCGEYGICVYGLRQDYPYLDVLMMTATATAVKWQMNDLIVFAAGEIINEIDLRHRLILPLIRHGRDFFCISSEADKLHLERTLRGCFGMPCGGIAVYPYSAGYGKSGVYLAKNKKSFTNNQWRA